MALTRRSEAGMLIHRPLISWIGSAAFVCAVGIACSASDGAKDNGNNVGGASASAGQPPLAAGGGAMTAPTTATGGAATNPPGNMPLMPGVGGVGAGGMVPGIGAGGA